VWVSLPDCPRVQGLRRRRTGFSSLIGPMPWTAIPTHFASSRGLSFSSCEDDGSRSVGAPMWTTQIPLPLPHLPRARGAPCYKGVRLGFLTLPVSLSAACATSSPAHAPGRSSHATPAENTEASNADAGRARPTFARQYPSSRTVEADQVIFGTTVRDPSRWLEEGIRPGAPDPGTESRFWWTSSASSSSRFRTRRRTEHGCLCSSCTRRISNGTGVLRSTSLDTEDSEISMTPDFDWMSKLVGL